MPATDLELLARYIADQDAEAFAELVSRHRDMVYATCYRVSWSTVDAEDAAQECFVYLARSARSIQASVAGWLHRVAVRTATAALQKDRSRQKREEEAATMTTAPEEEALWDEIRPEVDRAIDRLPDALRQPLVLHYLEGIDQAAIATELRLSQSAVSRRIKKAVEQVRKHLSEKGIVVATAVLATLLATETGGTAPPTLVAALGRLSLAGVSPLPVSPPVALTGAVRAAIAGWQGKAVCLIAAAVVGHALFRQTTRGDLTAPRQHTPSRVSAPGVPTFARSHDGGKIAGQSSPSHRGPSRELAPDGGRGQSGQETRLQPTIPNIERAVGPQRNNSNPTRPRRTPKMKRTMKEIAVAGLLAAAPVAHTQPPEQPAFTEQVRGSGKSSRWTARELGAAPASQQGREKESVEDRAGQGGAVEKGPVASDVLRRAQSKRVSISQPKISVQRLLDEVSKQVGLPLQVDDLLKYQKLIIYVDDYPFGSFQKALSTLLDATWVSAGDDDNGKAKRENVREQGEPRGNQGDKPAEPGYRLVPSEHRLRAEQEFRETARELLLEQLRTMVERTAAGGVPDSWLKDWPQDDKDGLRRWVEEMRGRSQVLSGIPQEMWGAILSGEPAEFPVAQMEGDHLKKVREFARRFAMPVSSGYEPNEVDKTVLVVYSEPRRGYQIYPGPGVPPPCPPWLTLYGLNFGFEKNGFAASRFGIAVDPKAYWEALRQRVAELAVFGEESQEGSGPSASNESVPDSAKPLRGREVTIGQVLEKIAQSNKLALLSDVNAMSDRATLNWEGETLGDFLSAVAQAFGKACFEVEGCCIFRGIYAWRRDDLELPEERVAEWREMYNRKKVWDEATLLEMAALSEPQVQQLRKMLPEASMVDSHYRVLHFYSALSTDEKAMARSQDGLPMVDVSAAKKAAYFQSSSSGGHQFVFVEGMIRSAMRGGRLKVSSSDSPPPGGIHFLFEPEEGKKQHDRPLPYSTECVVPLSATNTQLQLPGFGGKVDRGGEQELESSSLSVQGCL